MPLHPTTTPSIGLFLRRLSYRQGVNSSNRTIAAIIQRPGPMILNEHNRSSIITAVNEVLLRFDLDLLLRLALLLSNRELSFSLSTMEPSFPCTLSRAAMFVWHKLPPLRRRSQVVNRFTVFFYLKIDHYWSNVQVAFMLLRFLDLAISAHIQDYEHDPRALPVLTNVAYRLTPTTGSGAFGVMEFANLDTAYSQQQVAALHTNPSTDIRSLARQGRIISTWSDTTHSTSDEVLLRSLRPCLMFGRLFVVMIYIRFIVLFALLSAQFTWKSDVNTASVVGPVTTAIGTEQASCQCGVVCPSLHIHVLGGALPYNSQGRSITPIVIDLTQVATDTNSHVLYPRYPCTLVHATPQSVNAYVSRYAARAMRCSSETLSPHVSCNSIPSLEEA
ncbi:hypothetical protein PHLGIDRAFT_16024 [Phlebiopsis gigantea 11061_1 CR5-6]|uniref:Uncharacterized protein n=1 Tax=Phlebiopsis gigantea (strain 11061_1 CR5-6) TaxID=745531 RepID=A0A0C3PD74_PHLG1|nr:hypothetical protein PHLGIDRAFT_16024 [Phlebiopsis gigantea 11061_1 CR5-6]